jgi:lysozyme
MITNAAGVALIKRFETFQSKAYLCPAGVPTIGYGHTGTDVRLGQTITEHQADVILALDLERFERGVTELVAGVDVTENQFAALVSLAFNIGLDALGKSTLLRKLRTGAPAREVAAEFERWVHASGKRLRGLELRRDAERALFLGGE